MPILSLADADIYYEVHGNGPPLCLVAGLASDSQSWLPIIGELAADYRTILFDNRGAGRTRCSEETITIPNIANDCLALFDHLGLPSVSLLGHSMGGFIAQEFALSYPDRLHSLILVATSPCNSKRNNQLFADWASSFKNLRNASEIQAWFRNLFFWILSPSFFNHPQAVDQAVQAAIEYPYPQTPSAFAKQVEAIAAFDRTHDLHRFHVRTLLLNGQNDSVFPQGTWSDILPPNVLSSQIDNAAHAVHLENPNDFVSCVKDFLSAS